MEHPYALYRVCVFGQFSAVLRSFVGTKKYSKVFCVINTLCVFFRSNLQRAKYLSLIQYLAVNSRRYYFIKKKSKPKTYQASSFVENRKLRTTLHCVRF